MVRWGFKNMTYQKVMCLKEIEPCDQNLLTILLDSTFNLKFGKLHGHLMRTCTFTLITKMLRKINDKGHNFELLPNHLALTFHGSYPTSW